MKKILLVIAACAMATAGCNDNDSDTARDEPVQFPEAVATPATNVLTIQGEGINQQQEVTTGNYNIEIRAEGNQPLSSISLNNRKAVWPGQLMFDPASNHAQLTNLQLNNGARLLCFAFELAKCQPAGSYQWATLPQVKQLKFSFKQAGHILYEKDAGTAPENQRAVKLSGDIQFDIPANWPVLSNSRFPLAVQQGQLSWNGQQYSVTALERPLIEVGEDGYSRYGLTLKNSQHQEISLQVSIYNNGNVLASVADNDGVYRLSGAALKTLWQADQQKIRIYGSSPLTFKADNPQFADKVLLANLTLPKASVTATLGVTPLVYRDYYTAFAFNDTRVYNVILFAGNGDEDSSSLAVIQYANGNWLLEYELNGATWQCGSRVQSCAGLSMDADQKIWRFNHVKLGTDMLNGSLYIPGVFS